MAKETVREAVGVFHDEPSLVSAVDELLISGFDRSSLSLVAGHSSVERKLGHMYEKVAEIEDNPDAPHLAYIGTDSRTEGKAAVIGGLAYVGAIAAVGAIVASGGTIAAALIGATAAAGGSSAVGGVLVRLLGRHHASYLQEQLNRGGLLLWVATHDHDQEKLVCEILNRNLAEDVHVHDLPRPHYAVEGGLSYDLSFMKKLGL